MTAAEPTELPPPGDSPAQGDAAAREVAPADLPKLQAPAQGVDGSTIGAEPVQLTGRDPLRARRYRRDLLARIHIEGEQPEVALVRDISGTGVRLQLSAWAHLDIASSRRVIIEMRYPGSAYVRYEAKLVRVADHREDGVELAFTFSPETEHDPALHELLARLAADETRRQG